MNLFFYRIITTVSLTLCVFHIFRDLYCMLFIIKLESQFKYQVSLDLQIKHFKSFQFHQKTDTKEQKEVKILTMSCWVIPCGNNRKLQASKYKVQIEYIADSLVLFLFNHSCLNYEWDGLYSRCIRLIYNV